MAAKTKNNKSEYYNGNKLLKKCGIPHKFTLHQIEELEKCENDIKYFINKYVKIVTIDKGLVPFNTFPYQDRIANSVTINNSVIIKMGRQAGKTSIVSAILLWHVLFNDFYTIAICANKAKNAASILARVKLAYVYLPKWMQQGVETWNKGDIELENGSKILTYATSEDSARGETINCVTGDTFITVKDQFNEEKYNTISYFINNIGMLDGGNYKVLTDNGFKKFDRIISQGKSLSLLKLTFNNTILKCTLDHRIKMFGGDFKTADNLVYGDITSTGEIFISSEIIDNEQVYDLLNVKDTHSYITNNVISHNCLYLDEFCFVAKNIQTTFFDSVYPTISSGETSKIIITSTPKGLDLFYKIWTEAVEGKNGYDPIAVHWSEHPKRDEAWKKKTIDKIGQAAFDVEFECEFIGSQNTLISPNVLKMIPFKDPIAKQDNLVMYHKPEIGRNYVTVVDTSRGLGLDYSAFVIFDITESPFKIVAVYRNNTIPVIDYPNRIFHVSKIYNEAYILVETNDLGEQVADILFNEFEYDNIFYTKNSGRRGIELTGSGYKSRRGVKTTKATKAKGCSNLKTLVENEKLIINDYDTLFELTNFISVKNSYEADTGYNDDLAMCLVLFSWMTDQKFFKVFNDIDIRELMIKEKEARDSEKLLSFFITNGIDTDQNQIQFGNTIAEIVPEEETNWLLR